MDHEKLEDQPDEEAAEIIHKCDFCGKSFTVSANLKRHISIVHKDVKDPNETKRRIRTKDVTECVCKTCLKSFRGTANLRTHIRNIHEGKKDYKCTNCGKGFFKNAFLIEHIQFAKNFECLQKFQMSTNIQVDEAQIKRRIRKHTKNERVCDSCGKSFYDASSLKTHMRSVHKGERENFCGTCGKAFFRKAALNEHIGKK